MVILPQTKIHCQQFFQKIFIFFKFFFVFFRNPPQRRRVFAKLAYLRAKMPCFCSKFFVIDFCFFKTLASFHCLGCYNLVGFRQRRALIALSLQACRIGFEINQAFARRLFYRFCFMGKIYITYNIIFIPFTLYIATTMF